MGWVLAIRRGGELCVPHENQRCLGMRSGRKLRGFGVQYSELRESEFDSVEFFLGLTPGSPPWGSPPGQGRAKFGL